QLSWRSTPRLSRWRRLLATRGVDGTGAGERGEGRLASHSVRVVAGDEQLSGADRPDAAPLEQLRGDLGEQGSASTLDLRYLLRESLHALAEPPQRRVAHPRALPGARAQDRER